MSFLLKLITLISFGTLINAAWPGQCPRVNYPKLRDGWEGATGLWYRSAQSNNPVLPGDPKVGCAYARFEEICKAERPWFFMKDYWYNYNETKTGKPNVRYVKVEPYTWNNLPQFWFVGAHYYEMLDVAEDDFMFVFICQGYRGQTHDEDAILWTRKPVTTDEQKKYLEEKMSKAMTNSNIQHVQMKWLDFHC